MWKFFPLKWFDLFGEVKLKGDGKLSYSLNYSVKCVWNLVKRQITLPFLLQLLSFTISWACPLSIWEERVQSCQRSEGSLYSECTQFYVTCTWWKAF